MTAHDPCCCLDDMPGSECPVCASIALARGEERAKFTAIWKANLPLIEVRNYERGFIDGRASR
jgi:hypothetical protein